VSQSREAFEGKEALAAVGAWMGSSNAKAFFVDVLWDRYIMIYIIIIKVIIIIITIITIIMILI